MEPNKVHVVPVNGAIVRQQINHQMTGRPPVIPSEGASVEWNSYYERKVQKGDLAIVPAPEIEAPRLSGKLK